ncbi:MAG: CRISPR-associated endonuclease Cas2 [Lachnospiraceae bacterium]|nr:CRISPR-associated endonuclease Cas2 [Lachnospiraceae bacterium]
MVKSDKAVYHVLVIYDIVNDKRRTRYADFLSGFGYRVQKSCFEAVLSKKLYKSIIRKTPEYFDKEEDSIRIYILSDNSHIAAFGTPEELIYEKAGIL